MLKEIGCFILDSDGNAISKLKSYIDRTPGLILKGSSANPYFTLKELQDSNVLLFLETTLGKVSGIEIAKNLDNRAIFTTDHKEYALESFDNENTIDYIVKPITYDRFLKAIKKVSNFMSTSKQFPTDDILQFKINGQIFKIDVHSIDYIKSAGNYSNVFFSNRKILAPINLSNIEPRFPPGLFVRVHRSYIVNKNKIVKKCNESLMLVGGNTIKIGRTYRMGLKW